MAFRTRSSDPMRALRSGAVVFAIFAGGFAGATETDVAARPPYREDSTPRGVGFEDRVAEIRRRIQEALVYPPLARKREVEGTSEVAFEISPAGEARALELERSSGSTLLDRAAERAVRDAAPLPPVLGRLRIPVRFELAEASRESER
jgi:TonB family protein